MQLAVLHVITSIIGVFDTTLKVFRINYLLEEPRIYALLKPL